MASSETEPARPEEAETGPEAEPITLREAITVTASRREKPIYDEPAIVEVVNHEDLRFRQKIGNFVDAFAEMAAVSVQKTAQGQGSPFIRGFTGFHNLLLIDGVRFNNSILRSGPNQYWATLDPLAAARLEMVKGPGSVLYGSDAVGGTVNVITPKAPLEEPVVGGAIYTRWSDAERAHLIRAEAQGSYRGKLGYLLSGSFKDYGDFRAGGDTGIVENSAYDEHGVDAKVRFRPRDDRELTFLFQSFRQDDVPRTETTSFSKPFHGTEVGNELRRDHDQERSLAYLQYRRVREGPVREAEYTLAYQTTEEERIRVRGDRRSDLSGFSVGTWSVQTQFRSPSRWGLWTYGAEVAHDSVDSFRTDFNADGSVRRVRIQGAVADDASYERLGIYVQNEISLVRDRLTLIQGGRFNAYRLDTDRVEDPATGEEISLSDDWSKTVGSVRVLWRPDAAGADRWRVFGSVSQAFRAPNLSDVTALDATSAVETPTPGLEPESYLTTELGVKVSSNWGAFSGSYFYTVIDDQIVQSPTGRFIDGTPEVQKDNVGDGFVQGVEVAGTWRARPGLEVWANLSWMEGQVDQFLFSETGEAEEVRAPVSRLVPWMSHWGVRYDPPASSWWLELHGTAFSRADKLALRDRTDTRRIPPGGTPGFAVFGIRGAITVLQQRLTLAGGVENLLDEDYRIHGSGQNMPGRSLVASAAWGW